MALQLDEVLEALGMSQYLDAFIEQGFDSWDIVLDITESDLEALGVKLGHRRKLQRRIASYRGIAPDVALMSPARPTVEEAPRFEAVSRPEVSVYATEAQGPVPGVLAKRKYRRHPKPDDFAPERPPSAYVLFSNKLREELRDRNLSFTEIAKLVGENWQSLSAAEREPFESQAQAAKERYNHDLAEYKKTPEYRNYMAYLQDFKAKHANQSQDKNAFKRIRLSEHSSASPSSASYQSHQLHNQNSRLRQTSHTHRARSSATRGSRSGSESLREHDHDHEHGHHGDHDGDCRYAHESHDEHEHDDHDDHDTHDEHDDHDHDDHDEHGSHSGYGAGHGGTHTFLHGRDYRVGSTSSVSNSQYSASPAQGGLDTAARSPAHTVHSKTAHAPHHHTHHAHHTHQSHHSEGSPLRTRLSASPRDAPLAHVRQRSDSTSHGGVGGSVSLPSLADMFDQRQLGTASGAAAADAAPTGASVAVPADNSPGPPPVATLASSSSMSSSSSSSTSGASSAMSSVSSASSASSARTPMEGTLPIHVLLSSKAAEAAGEHMPSPPAWQPSAYAPAAVRQAGGQQFQFRS